MRRITHRLANLALKSGVWLQRRSNSANCRDVEPGVGFGNGRECFVGYFGLNRCPDITSSTIDGGIIRQLSGLGYRIVSAAHFNCPKIINSPRSGEHNVAASHCGTQTIEFELIWQEPQREHSIEPLASEICAKYAMGGEADESEIIRRNAMFQMYSQARLLTLLRLIGFDRFEVFCFTRPDLLFLDKIPAESIKSISDGSVDVITPSWHRWGGINDRFALCSRRGAEVYLSRLDWVSRFCAEKGYFHPEEILLYSIERSGLRYNFMPTRARRVRSNGLIKDEDFSV